MEWEQSRPQVLPAGQQPETIPYRLADPSTGLTVERASKYLDVSTKTIRRHIETGEIIAAQIRYEGRKRYLIERWALERYKLIKSKWLDQQMAEVSLANDSPSTQKDILGGLGTLIVFIPWGEHYRGQRLPQVELEVSIEDYWRFAFDPSPPESLESYEGLRNEIRKRILGEPQDFVVHFRLNQKETEHTLKTLAEAACPSLVDEAVAHLKSTSLPFLRRCKRNPLGYLYKCALNFCLDKDKSSSWAVQLPHEADYFSDHIEDLPPSRRREKLGRFLREQEDEI